MRDTDNKTSKGFGFICYSAAEEANRAVAEMNGKPFAGKPLMVTLHQRKDHRRAHLAATYAPRNNQFQQGGMPGPNGQMPFMNMYMQQGQPGFPGGPQPRGIPFPYPGTGPMGGRGAPRGMPYQGRGAPGPQGGFPFPGQQVPPFMQGPGGPMGGRGAPRGIPGAPQYIQQQPQGMPMGGRGAPRGMPMGAPQGVMPGQGMRGPAGPMGGVMGVPPQQRGPGPQMGYPQQMGVQGMPQQQRPGGNVPGGIKFTNQVRNQGMPMQQGMPQQQAQQVQNGNMDFSDAVLASADPVTQKNMIGERLYPLIYQHQPEQAGKITGMLLEMDNGELLNLIESPDALMSKIDEALSVLRNHQGVSE
jgi:polyadenylate-binding protein